ncbi:hypothetical protein GGF49_003644 [Coemansia sp. RSA 1853]|nr:hypothetical protein GGF49_003644 [Coemansia sp. RSA 1853]
MSSSTVRVALRIRPLSPQEHLNGETECVTQLPGVPQIVIGADRAFTFDHVFAPEVGQEQVYDDSIKPLVTQFLQGYNATVLAYGQTGSGKTFSMGTGLTQTETEAQGVVPQAISEIWSHLEKRAQGGLTYSIDVSFLELYNEDLIDLLNPRTAVGSRGPTIREDSRGNMVLVGVERMAAQKQSDILEYLRQGALSRTTASTDMNRTSSRSHAIFTIHLRQQDRRSSTLYGNGDASGENVGMDGGPSIVSKIHFVDLAGSERIKRTGAAGDRAKEGISINAGLLALGNVISALGSVSGGDRSVRRTPHVPYRDSKLTRLLQDSLGGNSQTLMLACISPSSKNSPESLNTIRYANRARNIRNRVAVNFDKNSSAELSILKTEVARLRGELSKHKLQRRQSAAALNDSSDSAGLVREVEQLRQRNTDLVQRLNVAQRRVMELENDRDALREQVAGMGGSVHSTPGLPAGQLPAEESAASTRPNSLFAESDVLSRSNVLETIDRELAEQASRHENQIGSVRRHYESKLELVQETLGIVQKERDVALQRLANAGTPVSARTPSNASSQPGSRAMGIEVQPAGTPTRLRMPSRAGKALRAGTPQLRKPPSAELRSTNRTTPPPPSMPRFGTSLGLVTVPSPSDKELQSEIERLQRENGELGARSLAEAERLAQQIHEQAEEIAQLRQKRTGRNPSNRYSLLSFKETSWGVANREPRHGGPQLLRAAFIKAVLEGELQRCVRARQLLRERDAFLTKQDRLMNEQNDMLLRMQTGDGEHVQRASERIEIIDAELHYLDLQVRDAEAEVAQLAEAPATDGDNSDGLRASGLQMAPVITNLSGLAMRMVEDVVRIDYGAFAELFDGLPRADSTGLAYLLMQDIIEHRLIALRDEHERVSLDKQLTDSRRTLLAMQRTALNSALSYERELGHAERRLTLVQSPADESMSLPTLPSDLDLGSLADSSELPPDRSVYDGVRERGILLRSALMSALESGDESGHESGKESEVDVNLDSPVSSASTDHIHDEKIIGTKYDEDDESVLFAGRAIDNQDTNSLYSESLGVSGLQVSEPLRTNGLYTKRALPATTADVQTLQTATNVTLASTPIDSNSSLASSPGPTPLQPPPTMFFSDPEGCESDTEIPELYRSGSGEFFRLPNLAHKPSTRKERQRLMRRMIQRKQVPVRHRGSKRRRGSLRRPRISLPIVPPELVEYIEQRNPNAIVVGDKLPIIAPPELVCQMREAEARAGGDMLLSPGSMWNSDIHRPGAVRAAGRVATQSASDEITHESKSTLQTDSLPTSDPAVMPDMAPAHGLRSPSSFYLASSPYVHSNQISYKSIVGTSQAEPVFCAPASTEGPGMMAQASSPTHRYLSPTERAHASLFSMMDAGRAPGHEFPVPTMSPPPVPAPFIRVPSPVSGEYIRSDKPLAYKPSRIRRRAQSSFDPRTIDESDMPRQEAKPNGRRLSKFFGFGLGSAAKQKRDGWAPGGMTTGVGARDRTSSESAGSRMRKVQSTIDAVVGERPPWSVDSRPGSVMGRPMTAVSDRNLNMANPSFR